MLHEWLARPHVAEWWTPTPSLAEVIEQFRPLTTPGRTRSRLHRARRVTRSRIRPVIRREGQRRRLVARRAGSRRPRHRSVSGRRDSSRPRHRNTDDPQLCRAALCRSRRDLHPNGSIPENARAIRCYEKAGFRRVGEVDTPDGRALLMVCVRGSALRSVP